MPESSSRAGVSRGARGTFAPDPDADTSAPKKIDDNSFENVWKKGGKATVTVKAVVSKDGKTYTVTQTGKNAKGETVNITSVYEKQ